MKSNILISKGEHYSLLIFAFIALLFVISVISFEHIKEYNYTVAETQNELRTKANAESIIKFSGTNGREFFPGLHLLTLFIFIALLKTKMYFISSTLTIFYSYMFIFGLSASYYNSLLGGEEFSPKVDFLTRIYRSANNLDYIAASFISILLFWQISILLRMLFKKLNGKEILP